MLITKTVEAKWHSSNKDHFLSKGYPFTKFRDKFFVSVYDLPNNSSAKVKAKCDYCGRETSANFTYGQYFRQALSSPVKTYSCASGSCNFKKRLDMAKYKLDRGELDENDPLYFQFEENLLKLLQSYLTKYGNLHQIRNKPEGPRLLDVFQKHKGYNMIELAKRLGYQEEELQYNPILGLSRVELKSESRINSQFEELKAAILNFMEQNNRFPSYGEASMLPGMHNGVLDKFGGIFEIRRRMGITDPDFLIDDRGWYNKSVQEWMVAQFLIHNKITYKREQQPFVGHNSNFRSDFTFYPEEGLIIHVEVWGYDETSVGYIAKEYLEARRKKLRLYKEYSKEIELISLDRKIFQRKTYEQIQSDLIHILKPVLNKKLKYVDQEVWIPPNSLSNEQLYEEFLKYTKGKHKPPLFFDLPNNLRVAIGQRFITYEIFLKQHNFHARRESTSVSIESLFVALETMIKEEGSTWNFKSYVEEYKDRFKGFIKKIQRNGGFLNVKLRFFEYCVEHGIPIVEHDQMFLIGMVQNKIRNITRQTEEQRILAVSILEKLNVDYEKIRFRHFNLRFSDEEVREIRYLKKNGATYRELCEKYQVSSYTINEALHGSTYSHVD